MSRTANTASKPKKLHSKPRIPKEAEAEILSALAQDMKISTVQIDEILRKHNVSGDPSALQRSYRLTIGQRLMASLRDEDGKREVLAAYGESGCTEYIVVNGCNDPQKLKAVRSRLQSHIAGLQNTSGKVTNRLRFLARIQGLVPHKKWGGANRRY